MPQHPAGEDAVEQGLHQCGLKKVLAFLAFELEAQRLFERAANTAERWQVRVCDAVARIACVRGQKPRHIFRVRQRGVGTQAAREEIVEALAL